MGNCTMKCCGQSKAYDSSKHSQNSNPWEPLLDVISSPTMIEQEEEKEEEEKGVVRVKFYLTKAEVAQLLAKDETHAILEQLAKELNNFGTDHFDVAKQSSSVGGVWRPVLESIPEVV